MKIKRFTLLTFFIVTTINVYSQELAIATDGETVFNLTSKADNRIELSMDGPEYTRNIGLWESKYQTNKNQERTVSKSNGLVFTGSLKNFEEKGVIDPKEFMPGLGARLLFVNTIKEFKKIVTNDLITWGAGIAIDYDSYDLYDTKRNKERAAHLISGGGEGYINFLITNKNNNENAIKRAYSLTGSIKQSSNVDEMPSYQDASKSITSENMIVLEDFKGKYGTIDYVTKYRATFAVPFFIRASRKNSSQAPAPAANPTATKTPKKLFISPVPYIAYNGVVGEHSVRLGTFLNFQLDGFKMGEDFKVPTTVGIGTDVKYSGEKFNHPHFAFKGSLSL